MRSARSSIRPNWIAPYGGRIVFLLEYDNIFPVTICLVSFIYNAARHSLKGRVDFHFVRSALKCVFLYKKYKPNTCFNKEKLLSTHGTSHKCTHNQKQDDFLK